MFQWMQDHPGETALFILAAGVAISLILWTRKQLNDAISRQRSGLQAVRSVSGSAGSRAGASKSSYASIQQSAATLRSMSGGATTSSGSTVAESANKRSTTTTTAGATSDVGELRNGAAFAQSPDPVVDILRSKGLNDWEIKEIRKTSPWIDHVDLDTLKRSDFGVHKRKMDT